MNNESRSTCTCGSSRRYSDCCGPLDRRLERVHQAIDEAGDFNPFKVRDDLIDLSESLRRVGRADDLERAIASFEQRRPEGFAAVAPFLQALRVESALFFDRLSLGVMLRPIARKMDAANLFLLEMIDRLCWHDCTVELLAFLEHAIGELDRQEFEMELSGHSLRDLAMHLTLDAWLDRQPELTGRERDLRDAVRRCRDIKANPLALLVAQKRGDDLARWKAVDLEMDVLPAELIPRVDGLMQRFAVELHTLHGWPSSRAYLARAELQEHLGNRLSVELGLGPHVFCPDCDPRVHKARHAAPVGMTALLPDVDSLFRNWNTRMMLPGALYRLGALLTAIPAWIDMLTRLNLVESTQLRRFERAFASLAAANASSLSRPIYDPDFERALAVLTEQLTVRLADRTPPDDASN